MSEMRPCPFCGMYGVSYETRQETGNKLLACEFCGLRIEARTFDEAEEAWNRRPLEDELAAALKGLLEHHGTPARWAAAKDALAKTREEGKE